MDVSEQIDDYHLLKKDCNVVLILAVHNTRNDQQCSELCYRLHVRNVTVEFTWRTHESAAVVIGQQM